MKNTDFENMVHDPDDPSPWQAIYLDKSVPIPDEVKEAWLTDTSTWCRQYFLPIVRPLARITIVFIQLVKTIVPDAFTSSTVLHNFLASSLKTWVTPEANWLILRHFHMGSEILQFIASNIDGVNVETNPLKPKNLDDLRDHLFVKHDLNLFNFVIRLNKELREKNIQIKPPEKLNFDCITDGEFPIEPMPDKWTNFVDISTAIDMFTPVYQLFLTDNDFWRATNSLQLDETIGIYASRILGDPQIISLVNNKHPMVPMTTLRAGYRLLLHGLSSEMLHAALVQHKRNAV